jgi:mannose-1-phosphate guanylyltransferase
MGYTERGAYDIKEILMNLEFPRASETVSPEAERESIESEKKKEAIARTMVYINAGGEGTRLRPVFPGEERVTKALVEFAGKPMVQNHADLLLRMGFKKVVIGAGDHFNVKEHFQGQEGERLSVVNTERQEDTGGDLIKAVRSMENTGKNILVENVDTLAYVEDMGKLLVQHEERGAAGTIVLTTRKGVPNEGAFYMDENGKIVFSKESRDTGSLPEPQGWGGFRGSSTGIVVLDAEVLRNYGWQSGDGKLSLYRDIIPQLIRDGRMFGYNNGDNLFVDTGTPEKYYQIKRHEDRLLGALGERYLDQVEE